MRRWRYLDGNDGLVIGGIVAAIAAAAWIDVRMVGVVCALVAVQFGLVRAR